MTRHCALGTPHARHFRPLFEAASGPPNVCATISFTLLACGPVLPSCQSPTRIWLVTLHVNAHLRLPLHSQLHLHTATTPASGGYSRKTTPESPMWQCCRVHSTAPPHWKLRSVLEQAPDHSLKHRLVTSPARCGDVYYRHVTSVKAFGREPRGHW